MARLAQDREDLLRDAKAFVERIELCFPSGQPTQELFAGFRANGAMSVYFGPDRVYHFNSRRELRRAFLDGQLLKAESRHLVALQTQRNSETVTMLRHQLSAEEETRFCDSMKQHLTSLQEMLLDHQGQILGQIPKDADIIARLVDWLSNGQEFQIANSPEMA